MTGKTPPEPVTDSDLEDVQGGGISRTHQGPAGYEPITLERSVCAPYIGETEKNVWKAPAGVTHDKTFEE